LKAGVQNKVAVQTADARALPFEASFFDVVVSHTVVHNIPDEQDLHRALSEMVCVMRPGGKLVLCDIEHRDAYLASIKSFGRQDCNMFFGPVPDFILGGVELQKFQAHNDCCEQTKTINVMNCLRQTRANGHRFPGNSSNILI
jgi:SAM-dependent methyltransferase